MDYLSSDSYELLKAFGNGLTIHDDSLVDSDSLEQLLSCGFVSRHIVDYDTSGDFIKTKYSDYYITPKGSGFLAYREYDDAFHQSVKEMSDAAKLHADLALHTSKKADVKGWLAVGISACALLLELIINHSIIIDFFRSLLNY